MEIATLKVRNSYCYLLHFTPDMVESVKLRLTYKNENAEYELFSKKKLLSSRRAQANPKFKFVLKKEITELEKLVEVCWLDLSEPTPKFPTGHLKIVEEHLNDCGFDYGVYDQREIPEAYNFFGWRVAPPELRYYQKAIVEAAEKHHRGIFESCVGCHAKGQQILMFDGTLRAVEDVKVGDILMGPDSNPRTVLRLFRGREQMYEVNPVKGEPFVVNENHILSLQRTRRTSDKDYGKTYTNRGKVSFMGHNPITNISVKDYLKKSRSFKLNNKLYRTGVNFKSDAALKLDPYILGLWLGDGSSARMQLTTMDDELAECWTDYAESFGDATCVVQEISSLNKAKTYTISNLKRGYTTRLSRMFRDLNLYNNKHIPHIYKVASRTDRLKLLAGIIDSDGHISSGSLDIVQKRENLIDDIAFLCRSLGLAAYKKVVSKRCVNTDSWGTYYRLSVSGDLSEVPTKLKRKQSPERKQKKSVLRTGFTVKPLGVENFYGFELDCDHLYLLDDFTVTHNSGKTLCMVNVVKLLEVNTLVIVPSLGLLEQIFEEFNTYLGGKNVQKITTDVVKRKKAYKPIRIVTAQTLASLQKSELLTSLVEDIDCLMIDEVHHSGAKTFTDLLPEIDHIYYRFGFSGTWVRSDAKELDMWGFLSGKLYEYPSRKAIEDGYLTPVTYHSLTLPGIVKRNYQAEYKANYCSNYLLFEKINELIQESIPSDHQILILVDQKELGGKVLHEFLIKNNVEATYMSGDTKKTEFSDTIKAFNNKDIRVLIATKVLGEGIDIKSTQHLILANGGKSVVKLVQGIGRCVRLYPDKKHSHVWDFNFLDTNYMQKHYSERLRIFEEEFNGDITEE